MIPGATSDEPSGQADRRSPCRALSLARQTAACSAAATRHGERRKRGRARLESEHLVALTL